MSIEPILDDRGKETGVFKLEIDFVAADIDAPDFLVADLARKLLEDALALLAFATGYPCILTKAPSARRPGVVAGTFRHLFFAAQLPLGPFGSGTLGPPPLLDEALLCQSLTDEQAMVLAWYRMALTTSDYIESCTALFAALEPLAGSFPCTDTRTETCANCGAKRELGASMHQRVHSFLTKQGRLAPEKAEAIWGLRNDMAHGRVARTMEQRRAMASLRDMLLAAMAQGLRIWLGTDYGGMPPPPEKLVSASDAILAVNYTVPDKHNEASPR